MDIETWIAEAREALRAQAVLPHDPHNAIRLAARLHKALDIIEGARKAIEYADGQRGADRSILHTETLRAMMENHRGRR